MAPIKDLRDYLRALESLGDLERFDRPVSAVLEAAAITRRSTEQRRPAPLFTNIEDAAPGFRMLGAAGALSSDAEHPLARVAVSLGLPYDVSAGELVEHLVEARGKEPISPKLISADSAPRTPCAAVFSASRAFCRRITGSAFRHERACPPCLDWRPY